MSGARPSRLLDRIDFALSGLSGKTGRRARKRLLKSLGPSSLADFESRVSRLGPDDTCLDLGANMGVYTEKLAATGAQVHAFEPDPHCFAALQRRFAGRPNVHLHPQAVSGEAGTFVLRRTRDFLKAPDLQSTSSSIAISTPRYYDDQNAVQVETKAFADVVKSLNVTVALVKMDIEGAEFAVLDQILEDSAAGIALPIGALFVETHERHFPDRPPFVKKLRAMNWAGKLPYQIDTFWP